MAKPFITFHAVWGNDDVFVDLNLLKREWLAIKRGKKVTRWKTYAYEGRRHQSYWMFNYPTVGELEIGYDDGGQGFVGRIDDLDFTIHSPAARSAP